MDYNTRMDLDTLLKTVAWYGEVFINTDGGDNWNKVHGFSIFTTPWIKFYEGIMNNEFHEVCEKLTSLNVEKGERDLITDLFERLLLDLNKLSPADQIIKRAVSIQAYDVKRIEDGLNYLYSKNIALDDFWKDGVSDKEVLLHVNNYAFKSILKAAYITIIHSFESQDVNELKKVKTQVEENLREIKNLKTNLKLLEIERNNHLNTISTGQFENDRLNMLIDELSKENAELKLGGLGTDEGEVLSDSISFKLALLYRLGLLGANIWPDSISQDNIGNVISKFIGEKKGETIKVKQSQDIGRL